MVFEYHFRGVLHGRESRSCKLVGVDHHIHSAFLEFFFGDRIERRGNDHYRGRAVFFSEFFNEFKYFRRIFFADGDALIVKTKDLLYILGETKRLYPEVERISIYGAPKDVLMKTDEELKELREAGLEMVYIGAESGDDEVLRRVKKNATHDETRNPQVEAKPSFGRLKDGFPSVEMFVYNTDIC